MIQAQEINQTFFGFHGFSDHLVDETKVKAIHFSAEDSTRLSLTMRRDSNYLPVSRLGNTCAVKVVYDDALLQSILETGEWSCREEDHGSTTLTRLPRHEKKEPVICIWTALLERWHMNKLVPEPAHADWSSVSNKIQERPAQGNNLRTFFNRRIGL